MGNLAYKQTEFKDLKHCLAASDRKNKSDTEKIIRELSDHFSEQKRSAADSIYICNLSEREAFMKKKVETHVMWKCMQRKNIWFENLYKICPTNDSLEFDDFKHTDPRADRMKKHLTTHFIGTR